MLGHHTSEWQAPPDKPVLISGEIHVWRASLERAPEQIQQLRQVLSPDELSRAERFHFERHRQHFIVGRGLLRVLLSRYLDRNPQQLEFVYSPQGKPALANTALHFNLSHSNGLVLYAVRRDRPVGIDIQHICPVEALQLAQRFFCTSEYLAIQSLSPEQQQVAFFNAWTRKEAYLKATGEGIAGLDQVEVTLTPREPAQLLSIAGQPVKDSQWFLQVLDPGPGYAAAVVSEGDIKCIQRWLC